MAGKTRENCENGIYHVVLREINRQDIFYDEDDFKCFLEALLQKSEKQFGVYDYCLMNNHVHLLLRENTDTISRIMSRIELVTHSSTTANTVKAATYFRGDMEVNV